MQELVKIKSKNLENVSIMAYAPINTVVLYQEDLDARLEYCDDKDLPSPEKPNLVPAIIKDYRILNGKLVAVIEIHDVECECSYQINANLDYLYTYSSLDRLKDYLEIVKDGE